MPTYESWCKTGYSPDTHVQNGTVCAKNVKGILSYAKILHSITRLYSSDIT